MTGAAKKLAPKPELFDYLDYVEFLQASLDHLKKHEKLSLREASRRCGFSNDYLQKLLKRRMVVSPEALTKIATMLGLSAQDTRFLLLLREMAEAPTIDERREAYKKICRFNIFKSRNAKDLQAHEYLKTWLYPAIRELARVKGFQANPNWIQGQLRYKASKPEIQQALRFLENNGYLKRSEDGKNLEPVSDQRIDCSGGVYKIALADYHTELLELAIQSMFNDPAVVRKHKSHTMAIPKEKLTRVREILDAAVEEVAAIASEDDDSKNSQVVQVNVTAFPLLKD